MEVSISIYYNVSLKELKRDSKCNYTEIEVSQMLSLKGETIPINEDMLDSRKIFRQILLK